MFSKSKNTKSNILWHPTRNLNPTPPDLLRVFLQKTVHITTNMVLQGRLPFSMDINVRLNIQIIGKQHAHAETVMLIEACTATTPKFLGSPAGPPLNFFYENLQEFVIK